GILQLLPKPLLTPDQVELLRGDVTVSDKAKRDGRTLEALGIDPVAMAAIVPFYLWRFPQTGPFNATAGRRPGTGPALPRLRLLLQYPTPSAISPSAPTMTRHHANKPRPWRCT